MGDYVYAGWDREAYDPIGKPEIATQDRLLRLFHDELGYDYLGNLKPLDNKNLRVEDLYSWLNKANPGRTELAAKALDKFAKAPQNFQTTQIAAANEEIYGMLKYGVSVEPEPGAAPVSIYLIDWLNPRNNDFYVAEEVTVNEAAPKRLDLVVYVNGIALAVIELKRSVNFVEEGIRQNITNQRKQWIPRFFATIQFCMAGNDTQGLRHGTTGTPQKHYYEWKNDSKATDPVSVSIAEHIEQWPRKLDRQVYSMFQKDRFIDLLYNFIVYKGGTKMVPRYNQFFGIKAAEDRMGRREGGIIWHTQGSGKTLTMVYLTRWILSNIEGSRVLLVTDRDELDEQIERYFRSAGESIVRTKSCADLIQRLNLWEDSLLCSLVHKFGRRSAHDTSEFDYDKSYDRYIEEVKASLPADFEAKGNIFVFVDECHRTQSGKLNKAMKAIMPNAVFVGFTGTPLLIKDKPTSIKTFGDFIHKYQHKQAVEDGVILDMKYTPRDVPQEITSPEKIDQYFDAKTKGLTVRAKARLAQGWATLQKMYSSRARLSRIAADIMFDFEVKPRLSEGDGNALLVADSVYSACQYYQIFQQAGFKKCAIITSFEPHKGDLRTDSVDVDDGEDTENFFKYQTYMDMLDGKTVEDFEAEVKDAFVNRPDEMKLLIVVDKLLTGFDAPPCTYLYIDKSMQDHGLFQAVCRVNRIDDRTDDSGVNHGESKDFGYIIDYKQLFSPLQEAMQTYAGDAFAGYDDEDVEGVLDDFAQKSKERFIELLDTLDAFCERVPMPQGEIEFTKYFCGEGEYGGQKMDEYAQLRGRLYSLVGALVRAFADFSECMDDLGYSDDEREAYRKRVVRYDNLKKTIMIASGDALDLKAYAPAMRHLIDTYIDAGDSKELTSLDDFTLLDFVAEQGDGLVHDVPEGQESAAATIEGNIGRQIVERQLINPKYYEQLSAILKDLAEERKRGVEDYQRLLERYKEIANRVIHPEQDDRYPESIRTSAPLRAIYDNTGCDEQKALDLDKAVRHSAQHGWRSDPTKIRVVKKALWEILHDETEVEHVYSIITEQDEY